MLQILFILVFAGLAFQIFTWEATKLKLKEIEKELRDLSVSKDVELNKIYEKNLPVSEPIVWEVTSHSQNEAGEEGDDEYLGDLH